jgi:hypothetical protein
MKRAEAGLRPGKTAAAGLSALRKAVANPPAERRRVAAAAAGSEFPLDDDFSEF